MVGFLRVVHVIVGVLSLVLVAHVNCGLYAQVPAAGDDDAVLAAVSPQLAFVRAALDEGAGAEMQALFPEGYVFTHVAYGLAWVELGLRVGPGEPARERALAEARWASARLDTPAGRAPFPAALPPDHGMFYAAWTAWLLAGVVRLQPAGARDPDEVAELRRRCADIAAALEAAETPFLPSYPGQAWPVDTFPAIAALRVHTRVADDRYEPLIARWLEAVNAHLDPALGLVPHRTDPTLGALIEGARATSQVLMVRFLARINPSLGRQHYRRLRNRFFVTRLGLPGFLEYPDGAAGPADVDTGPLIAGVSLSASAVGLGAARVYGDRELAAALWQAGEALGVPLTLGGERRYALGLLPVGDALAAWSRSARPVEPRAGFGTVGPDRGGDAGEDELPDVGSNAGTPGDDVGEDKPSPEPRTGFQALIPWWWRWPTHGLSGAWLLLLALPLRRLWRRSD